MPTPSRFLSPTPRPRSEKIATECLKATGWGIESAIEHFYSSGLHGSVPAVDVRAIEQLFERYKGAPGVALCVCRGGGAVAGGAA